MKYSLEDVAGSLGLPPGTVERWIRQGRIPIHRSGEYVVFKKRDLERWAKKHKRTFLLPESAHVEEVEPKNDSLLAAIKRGVVLSGVRGNDVKSVLESAVQGMPDLSDSGRDVLFERLLARESLTPTGVGKGVAIPHPRTPLQELSNDPVIVTCFLEHPVDYGAVDDLPVSVLFILLSPSVKVHLQMLSRLAFCVRDNEFAKFLRSCPEKEALFDKIAGFEEMLESEDA